MSSSLRLGQSSQDERGSGTIRTYKPYHPSTFAQQEEPKSWYTAHVRTKCVHLRCVSAAVADQRPKNTSACVESANLQVLMRGKKLRMQLHNGSLLLTAPSVGLYQLLPHITHLHKED